MGKESQVEINGHLYRYEYVDGETVYRGPVGDAPELSEQAFEEFMRGPRWKAPESFKDDMKSYFVDKGIMSRYEKLPPPGTRVELRPTTIGEAGYSAITLNFLDKKPDYAEEQNIHWDWIEVEVGDGMTIGGKTHWIEGRTEARKWMKRYISAMGWKEEKPTYKYY